MDAVLVQGMQVQLDALRIGRLTINGEQCRRARWQTASCADWWRTGWCL